jgi:hypothetical protein
MDTVQAEGNGASSSQEEKESATEEVRDACIDK